MKLYNLKRKVACFVAFLLAANIGTQAQTNVAVAPINMNVLYIGVDNPLAVAASAAKDDNVTVEVSGGGASVSKTEAGRYNVRVATPTDDCLLSVYVDGKLAGTSNFRVRSLPEPNATVGGYITGTTLSADALRMQAGVGTYIRDFPFAVRYEVLGFSLSVQETNGTKHIAECEGSLFSPIAKQYINQYAVSGSTVSIEQIRAKDPSGRVYKLPSLTYSVK